MRITVHIPQTLEKDIKVAVQNDKISVSSFVAKALEYYIQEKRKKKNINIFLGLIDKNIVSINAEAELEKGRANCDNRF